MGETGWLDDEDMAEMWGPRADGVKKEVVIGFGVV
jgi:hypothetical protein